MNFTGISHGSVSRVLFAAAIAAVTTFLFPPARVFSADSFPFFCRGPFALETSAANDNPPSVILNIFFKTAKTGAGVYGENLQSGECAWAHRPTRALEGNILLLDGVGPSAPPAGLLGFLQVTQCSMNKECIVGFLAFSGVSGLQANSTPIDTLPKGDTTECGLTCIP